MPGGHDPQCPLDEPTASGTKGRREKSENRPTVLYGVYANSLRLLEGFDGFIFRDRWTS